MMRDEMEARIWGEHHQELSNAIDRALKSILFAFCRLARIQYDAPWEASPTKSC